MSIAQAFSEAWWDSGFSATLWSPHLMADIEIPSFKTWIQLIGIPSDCWKEDFVASAVSQFRVYLGTIESNEPGDMAIALPDLRAVPRNIFFKPGPFKYKVSVGIYKWRCGSVYGAQDFPPEPPQILPPSLRSPEHALPAALVEVRQDGTVTLSINSLRHIFRNVDKANLPFEFAMLLDTEPTETVAGDSSVRGVTLLRRDLTVTGGGVEAQPSTRIMPQLIPTATKRLSAVDIAELETSVAVKGGCDKKLQKVHDPAVDLLLPRSPFECNSLQVSSFSPELEVSPRVPNLVPHVIPPTVSSEGT